MATESLLCKLHIGQITSKHRKINENAYREKNGGVGWILLLTNLHKDFPHKI